MSEIHAESFATADEWDTVRARFSHDWLKNGFAVALGKFANVLSGAVEDPDAGRQVLGYLHEWLTRREEIGRLIDMAPAVLSPAGLFRQGPLAALDDESKKALAALMDEKWRRNVQPERIAGDAKITSQRVDAACMVLEDSMTETGCRTTESRGDQAALVAQLRNAIADFAAALGTLGRSRYVV